MGVHEAAMDKCKLSNVTILPTVSIYLPSCMSYLWSRLDGVRVQSKKVIPMVPNEIDSMIRLAPYKAKSLRELQGGKEAW